MQLQSSVACDAYVQHELRTLIQRGSSWHATPASPDAPGVPPDGNRLSWKLTRTDTPDSWYVLEARIDSQEFLIWFGNHQVGAEGLHWIMRPAVHVAFRDLAP